MINCLVLKVKKTNNLKYTINFFSSLCDVIERFDDDVISLFDRIGNIGFSMFEAN